MRCDTERLVLMRYLLTCAAALLLLVSRPAVGADRLIVLLCADTLSQDIAMDMKANLSFMESALAANAPESQTTIIRLIDEKFSRRVILETIRALEIVDSDSVLFSYCGHGYYIGGRGTYFIPPSDEKRKLYLSEILQAIQAKKPRLVASIVDCCSVIPDAKLGFAAPAEEPVEDFSPLFKSLFFSERGIISVNSSAPGEYALCRSLPERSNGEVLHGSLFTWELYRFMSDQKKHEHSWKDLCLTMRKAVARDFDRLAQGRPLVLSGGGGTLKQDTQTVWGLKDGKYLLSFEK